VRARSSAHAGLSGRSFSEDGKPRRRQLISGSTAWPRRYWQMSFISLEQLPFVGMSYEFVGEKEGAPFSAYIVGAKPGQGPPLHKHPYVEVAFTIEGQATITVRDEQREVKAGGIVVIPPDTPHRFVNSGDTTLRQIDIHASPKFIQTNL